MFRLLLTALVPLFVLYGVACYRSLQRNIRRARESGFKYVVAPVYFQSMPWILQQEALLPILRRLPKALTRSWLPLSLFFRIWDSGYEPFETIGADTFIVASPGGNVLWTCEPEIIMQLSNRHADFTKPVDMLGILNLYGPTITASEGEEHRKYRKIASPSFNETTHRTVWREAIHQAESMLEAWNRDGGLVSDLNLNANRFTLHVLSKALFNKEMPWDTNAVKAHGHELTYAEAIGAAFKYNHTLFMTPRAVLNHSPLQGHKLAKQAYTEFRRYMEEMVDEQKKAADSGGGLEEGNLLENFVNARQRNDALRIPDAAVFGNLFIFILAGHETSANTMSFALSLLACRPDFQEALRADVEARTDDRDPATWNYPQDYTRLMEGHVGALMSETMRLFTVLPFFPTTNERAQILSVGGVKHVVAPKTLFMINTGAVHRNPKHWSMPDPPSSFQPELWLSGNAPLPGLFIPFAEGFRSCMGSRFARVEFCAAIATICKNYTVMPDGGVGQAALRKAEEQVFSGVGFELGLKLKTPILLRFVSRAS
ncbi:cytochrome P450 [Lophiotrema nucula]|uniref:Cytochrome P450 n=1 Tax=Lophiotrema nucula TaxID=690887 RepID=A0A6A5YUF2_9PLEO|nr:cytochrome P450 [Lophiotrema nucula]